MIIIKDRIDELLKADALLHRDEYIEDAGFTLRVIDGLPVESRVSFALRLAILLGFTLLAAMFVACFAGGGNFLVDAAMDIATSSMSTSAFAFATLVCLIFAVSIAALSDN